jgi:hypothetical protein
MNTAREAMSTQTTQSEYLVISRGSWDKSLSADDIQILTDQFYAWYGRLITEGKIKAGHRLRDEGKIVAGKTTITDGPFAESKEVIGGFWFILANSLEEAAEIATGNPSLDHGIITEVRPLFS